MSDQKVRLLDQYGNEVQRPKGRALQGGVGNYSGPPYDAADLYGQHLAAWTPMLWSPDAELNMYRDRIVSRARDAARNDGWASGAVTRILDNAIGGALRPIAKPDYKFLAAYSGNTGFDHEWAREYSEVIEGYWRSWANTTYCDAARNSTFAQQMYLGFRHKLIDGDALGIMLWRPKRVGPGRARYATCVQLIDPDRLSNPQLTFDTMALRGGVEIDLDGAAIAYHIRRAHLGDWFNAAAAQVWDRIERENKYGRPIVVHDFDADRAATHRGGAGVLTPVLTRLKMLIKYDGVELDSAIINSIFAAYVESPFDAELVNDALSDGERLSIYQQNRMSHWNEQKLVIGNARVPIMFPGEKINSVAANRPASQFPMFEDAMIRNIATGVGISAQQLSNNWSDVNYSSARGALLESWKTLDRRRISYTSRFCGPIRGAWLEEVHEVDDLPMPTGFVPNFVECREAFSRCRWMGPGMGWVDPVAEKQGAVIGMDAALSTLEEECAQQGLDMMEVLDQRAYEISLFEERGIPLPAWVGQMPMPGAGGPGGQPTDATGASKKPEKPKAT